jgi:hypothetical protein
MPGFPKSRPPANAKALETWISQKAREDGVAVNRLRRGISFMVISAVLGRLVDDQGLPLFLLKGGVAMELRVGLQARASRDYDTAFRQAIDRVTHVLAEAESYSSGDFRVTPGKAVPIGKRSAPAGPGRWCLSEPYCCRGSHDPSRNGSSSGWHARQRSYRGSGVS